MERTPRSNAPQPTIEQPPTDDLDELLLPDGSYLTDEHAAEAGERAIEAARARIPSLKSA